MSEKAGVQAVPWSRPFVGQAELDNVRRVLESGWLSQGPAVEKLEARLCELTGSRFAVAMSSGTAALDVALKLYGVEPGDEVIVPAFAYIATVNSVLYQGATPVFADVDPTTFNVSAESVRAHIGPRTRGIIAIDYGGQAADWPALRRIADEGGLFLVEDAAPGLGGSIDGRALCTLGDVSITSFHMAKVFTTVEGGMLFTDDVGLADRARVIRSQGESPQEKYLHPELGHNYRMTDLQAAIGLGQFSRWTEVLRARSGAAQHYTRGLRDVPGVVTPAVRPGNGHAWFLYPILVPERDRVRAALTRDGVGTNVSWPRPPYDQPYLARYKKEACPVAEDLCRRVLCLPMYYELAPAEQDHVIEAVRSAVEQVVAAGTSR